MVVEQIEWLSELITITRGNTNYGSVDTSILLLMRCPRSQNGVELSTDGIILDNGVEFMTVISGELERWVGSSKGDLKMDSI